MERRIFFDHRFGFSSFTAVYSFSPEKMAAAACWNLKPSGLDRKNQGMG
jgi:hypothetical protein